MPYITDHKKKFDDLREYLENQDRIRRAANGGNSILFSYPPKEEYLYLDKAKELYLDKATFIDISQLLVGYIEQDGWDEFSQYYRDFISTPHVIFKSDDPSRDLFDMIIEAIEKASQSDTIPFLIRTGCLAGTGIENVNIIEDKTVMELSKPLVIFYPSMIKDEKLYFLNYRPASKYRCILVK